MTEEIIAGIRHVTYTHWNQTQPTLKDLSLELRQGTLNILVGPGGSGKSTLCDLFNGEIPHLMGGQFQGDVWINRKNTRDLQVKDLAYQVGHVFQDPESMFATLTVEDEIAFGPENLNTPPHEILKSVNELLKQTGLDPFRKNLVWALSGGQVQMLGLASELVMRPGLIILDEPTSNLDPGATQRVHEMVLELREQGITVLLVTRELDDFLAKADQLIVLENGQVLASGLPREVLVRFGDYMVNNLGIWLPETTEIGLLIKKDIPTSESCIPITIEETFNLLNSAKGTSDFKAESIETKSAPSQTTLEVETTSRLSDECLISARNLSYSYAGKIQALKGVSLDIHAGEMLAIVGRNGAGKSTLARLMVGLLKPQSGELALFGKPAQQWKVQNLANRVALVFQNPEHQFLTDTVAEEIEYSLLARGVADGAARKSAIQQILTRLGLTGYENIHPFALSAGMKRRLGVATMLVCEPQVLLVDEPTYGQDKQMTQTLMALMEDIRQRGIAVVMITHDMRLVQEYADRVIVMSQGQIYYDGSPEGLFEQEDVLLNANLRPTLLHQMIVRLRRHGYSVPSRLRNPTEFISQWRAYG